MLVNLYPPQLLFLLQEVRRRVFQPVQVLVEVHLHQNLNRPQQVKVLQLQ